MPLRSNYSSLNVRFGPKLDLSLLHSVGVAITLSELAENVYMLPHCLIHETCVLAGKLMGTFSILFLLSGESGSIGLVGHADLDTRRVSCDN